jgi:hypothetical protein
LSKRTLYERSIANAMFTVVRYWVMRSFSTSALIEITSAPVIPRSVGEGLDDLRPFDARDYARALVAG